ncbi:MAG: SdpI family protein [Thermoleophilia bacterium]
MSGDSLVVPLILAITCLSIGLLGALRRFPYGHWTGLRTRTTLSSRAAWEAAHVAAAPWMLAGGVAGLAVCALAAHEPHPSLLDGRQTPVAMGVEALFVVVATVIAQRAARRVKGG